LESILIQDGIDEIEVVISDNASDDNTAEMVESYVQRFPGIIK
jgi:glycosyltransferase involved in cell wall biosynthesis